MNQDGHTADVAANRGYFGRRQKNGRTFKEWFRKYFLEGQLLEAEPTVAVAEGSSAFVERHRKLLATLLPFAFMQTVWWSLAVRYDLLRLYPARFEMAVTMVFGAFVAGATSEGGGAVAFPVMTLLLKIAPEVARDFSLMIQTPGMSTSSFAILWMRIKVEWHSIVYCTLGSTVSMILGLQYWDDLLDGQQKKMIFVAIWFSFAISLLLLNLQKKRVTHDHIRDFCVWKAIVLVGAGFFGGLLSAFTGSGVDICSFSILTLLFRVSEKVATPTSVVLMFANACVGFYWRAAMQRAVSALAWQYFAVSVPVVVTCSPVGAFVSSHLHRQVLAAMVYALETLAVLGFLVTGPRWTLVLGCAMIILVGFAFFYVVAKLGEILNDHHDTKLASVPQPRVGVDDVAVAEV